MLRLIDKIYGLTTEAYDDDLGWSHQSFSGSDK